MITLDLEKITATLQSTTLGCETDETDGIVVMTQAISMASPVSPLSHHAALAGETRVSAPRVSSLSHHQSEHGETRQVVDTLDVQGPVSPVLPVSSDGRVAQTSPAPFFAGGRRPAPCLHQWLQEGQRATCESCGLIVPVLPKEDVGLGGPSAPRRDHATPAAPDLAPEACPRVRRSGSVHY
jgi:hypothetical protein